jgi:hypothetical protein
VSRSGTTRLAVGAVLVVALAAAACGGGGSEGLSKEDYAAKLNEICAATVEKADRPSSLPELVSNGPRLLAEFDKALPQAEALVPPDELKPDVDKFLSEYKHLRNLVSQLIDAAKKNDLAKVAQLGARADALGQDTAALARKLGAPACAQR